MTTTQHEVQKPSKKLVDQITAQVTNLQESGEINLPQNYSPSNAIKFAFMMLEETKDKNGTPIAQACTPVSIATAMMKMVVQGLSPAKNQCYFIPYGSQLNFQRSYQGSIAVAKRVGGVKAVNANVIFQGDTYETEINPETGTKRLLKHIQPFENRNDEKIIGAYAVVVFEDGEVKLEDMSLDEIRKSWAQGKGGETPAHKNFKGEMCKKTVINRALKTIINSSSDTDLFDEDDVKGSPAEANLKQEIKEKANKVELTFDEHEEVTEEPKPKQEKKSEKVEGPSFA